MDSAVATPLNQREITAYHEAGHCVAHVALGGGEVFARLLSDGRGLDGETISNRHDLGPRDKLVTASAGPHAEARFIGRTIPLLSGTSANDGKCIRDAIRELRADGYSELTLQNLPHIASMEAHKIVRTHWAAVTAVAERLLANGRISHLEILAICQTY